jgi:hypothetical protein
VTASSLTPDGARRKTAVQFALAQQHSCKALTSKNPRTLHCKLLKHFIPTYYYTKSPKLLGPHPLPQNHILSHGKPEGDVPQGWNMPRQQTVIPVDRQPSFY